MERAVIQSSADIRTAESEFSMCFARVVLPAPGSPQMMNSVAWECKRSCFRKENEACLTRLRRRHLDYGVVSATAQEGQIKRLRCDRAQGRLQPHRSGRD